MWLEYKGPVAEEAGATTVMEGMIDSLGPSVAVAYYDELAIQLRVNLMQVPTLLVVWSGGWVEWWLGGVVVVWRVGRVACWLSGGL